MLIFYTRRGMNLLWDEIYGDLNPGFFLAVFDYHSSCHTTFFSF